MQPPDILGEVIDIDAFTDDAFIVPVANKFVPSHTKQLSTDLNDVFGIPPL
jgi:hypothetical protein